MPRRTPALDVLVDLDSPADDVLSLPLQRELDRELRHALARLAVRAGAAREIQLELAFADTSALCAAS